MEEGEWTEICGRKSKIFKCFFSRAFSDDRGMYEDPYSFIEYVGEEYLVVKRPGGKGIS